MTSAVTLAGAHHVRIPVSDLESAVAWFADLLGYEKEFPFEAEGSVTGWALRHGTGGPALTLIADAARARACRGFPLFAFGVPDEAMVRSIAARLDARGIVHGGVQPALVKVKLPFVEGPDGILFGFYVKEVADP
ncbi:MAG: glyoxalase-like domain protein [Sphingomonas bacterium]|uniref:VOC family protein n=1 Tax=Sphingomonas bacterium TaxID=1895847 RepID=UPI00260BC636|nr:VOC family protein [Sphingomonas bacterium]MDB5704083.1 glyoxalase-like domain protein [Sphingomonas bacterium]